MTINSRAKGAKGELELAHYLTEKGFPAHRTAQRCGKGGDSADVVAEGLEGVHIECKRTERFNLYPALRQAQADAATGRVPVVMHRANSTKSETKEWVAVLTLEDFLGLVKKAQE